MPDLSLVIPVYNGASFIEATVTRVSEQLAALGLSYEIIIVNDGSTDNTADVLKSLPTAELKLFHFTENQGKGAAVIKGMELAAGDCCAFTDADLPYDLKALSIAHNFIVNDNFHLVIGDRTLPGSNYYEHLTLPRYIMTRAFHTGIRLMVTGEMFDTQCGFKAFRKDIAKELFPLLRTTRFAFDVELLYIALKYNLAIRKIPVRYTPSSSSTIQPLSHAAQMLRAASSVPSNWRRGRYQSELLNQIRLMPYWEEDAHS